MRCTFLTPLWAVLGHSLSVIRPDEERASRGMVRDAFSPVEVEVPGWAREELYEDLGRSPQVDLVVEGSQYVDDLYRSRQSDGHVVSLGDSGLDECAPLREDDGPAGRQAVGEPGLSLVPKVLVLWVPGKPVAAADPDVRHHRHVRTDVAHNARDLADRLGLTSLEQREVDVEFDARQQRPLEYELDVAAADGEQRHDSGYDRRDLARNTHRHRPEKRPSGDATTSSRIAMLGRNASVRPRWPIMPPLQQAATLGHNGRPVSSPPTGRLRGIPAGRRQRSSTMSGRGPYSASYST